MLVVNSLHIMMNYIVVSPILRYARTLAKLTPDPYTENLIFG